MYFVTQMFIVVVYGLFIRYKGGTKMQNILMCGTEPIGQVSMFTEQSAIATVVTNPTTVSISNGSHFMLDGVRYKATANISAGGNIQVGTNCVVESVESSLVESLTITGGTISNVGNIRANIINNKILVISGVGYSNDVAQNGDIIDLGKSFGEYFTYAYSIGNGIFPLKVSGTKLKGNVAIPQGNIYMSIVIVL